jgi:transglutaminase-like putative cysteine protease
MAANRAPSAPRIALAALNAAAAIGLVRVFAGAAWLVPAVLAAVLPHALFALSDRRRWSPIAALIGICVIGTAFAMVVVDPHTTFFGLPTTATLHAFADHTGLSTHVLRTAVVPVPPIGAALSLALLSIWLVSTTADWLLTRLDATLGAVGPSLVLFVAVGALGKGSQWPTTFLYGLGVAGFLLAVHYAELVDRRTWFHLPRRRRSRLLAGGTTAAIGAVALALVLGPLLPGARSDPWFNYRGLGTSSGGGTWHTVTPLVDIKTRLVDESNTELFTVKASHAAYWRMVALDSFNGQVWGLQADAPSAGTQLAGSNEPPYAQRLVQQFHIEALSTRWLPAAYEAQSVTPRTNTLYIPDSVSLVTSSATSDGAVYTVVSDIPTPTADQLRAAPATYPASIARDVQLPKGFPTRVTKLATTVTARATTPYDKALALQTYLRDFGLYTYDLNVPAGHSDRALERFLFDTRRGYCEQFAGSFAAMARSIGLPARVAVGFTPGTDSKGVFHVTDQNAHAWPEVWLQGFGWMPFEPTPGRFEPTATDPTGTGKDAPAATATTATTAPQTATTAPKSGPAPSIDPKTLAHQFGINLGGSGATPHHQSVGPRVLLALAGIVALAIITGVGLLLGVIMVKMTRRRRRRHADDTRDRVTGAWAEAIDRLREAGVEPRASATPVEFAMRHAAAHGAGAAGPPLMDLARLQTAALFAGDPPTSDEADAAWEHVEQIEGTLRHATNRSRRWRRRLDPRSLRVPAGAR